MTTSEQRARARKTRKGQDIAADQGVKPKRGRESKKISWDIPKTWRCEGQMELFDPRGEQ
ncbi:hypothetical protein [Nocardia sp. NPDC056100]|uniref:hypothetical protein n=1 Tax=Nocardia sp. NPDC056100 TaxID=3345712 RepID=UPI0035DC380D